MNDIVWLDRGWQPVRIGFCPTKKAWKKEMKRINCDREYIRNNAQCDMFKCPGAPTLILVTIDKSADTRNPIEVIGLLMHEAVHVWQRVCDEIGEEDPGWEMEAYAIQSITQDLIQAFEETRRKLFG